MHAANQPQKIWADRRHHLLVIAPAPLRQDLSPHSSGESQPAACKQAVGPEAANGPGQHRPANCPLAIGAREESPHGLPGSAAWMAWVDRCAHLRLSRLHTGPRLRLSDSVQQIRGRVLIPRQIRCATAAPAQIPRGICCLG